MWSFLFSCASPPPPALPEAPKLTCDWEAEGTYATEDHALFAEIPFPFMEIWGVEPGGISSATQPQLEGRNVEVWRDLRRGGQTPWRSITVEIPGTVTQLSAGCSSSRSATGLVVQGVVPVRGPRMVELLSHRTEDSLGVALPSRSEFPQAWMLVSAYAAKQGRVRVYGSGDPAGAFPSWIEVAGGCSLVDVNVTDVRTVEITGAPEQLLLSAREGTVWARLRPGTVLRQDSAVYSDKAAWIYLPADTNLTLQMDGDWRVLCANTGNPACAQPTTSQLTLGHGGPTLRLTAPRGRVLLYQPPASVEDRLTDCSPPWHNPAVGKEFLRLLATGPLHEPCGDFGNRQCWDMSRVRTDPGITVLDPAPGSDLTGSHPVRIRVHDLDAESLSFELDGAPIPTCPDDTSLDDGISDTCTLDTTGLAGPHTFRVTVHFLGGDTSEYTYRYR